MPSTLAALPLLDSAGQIARIPHRHARAAPSVRLTEVGAEGWDYCRSLACANMTPYLLRRKLQWNRAAWDAMVPTRRFYFIMRDGVRYGFASVYEDIAENSLHLGDLQLELAYVCQGTGTQALQCIELHARTRHVAAITLNVFYDNPALRLYERHGFIRIHFDGDKIRMRKFL